MSTTIDRPKSAHSGTSQKNPDNALKLQVFILGSPRSGTSITYHAMRQVFGLPGEGESHVFPVFQRMIHLFYNYALEFQGVNGVLARRLDTASFKRAMADYIRAFYADRYAGGGWVDKTPGAEAILGAELVAQVFPSAKFLLLQRNGIEIVQSAQKKFQMTFEDACRGWANCMQTAQDLRSRDMGLLDLDQYELSNAPEAAAGKIARYLDRPEKEGELADFFKGQRVDKTSDHDWSRRMSLADVDWSDEQKATFEQVCGEWMLRAGYPLR